MNNGRYTYDATFLDAVPLTNVPLRVGTETRLLVSAERRRKRKFGPNVRCSNSGRQ